MTSSVGDLVLVPYTPAERWLLAALIDEHGRRWLRLFQFAAPDLYDADRRLLADPDAATLVAVVDTGHTGDSGMGDLGDVPCGIVSLFDLDLLTGSVWLEPLFLSDVPAICRDRAVVEAVAHAFRHWPIHSVRVREPADAPTRLESLVDHATFEGELPDAM